MSKEFKLLQANRPDRFEDGVSKLLNEGWEISGNPFIAQSGSMAIAMVRTTKETPRARTKVAK